MVQKLRGHGKRPWFYSEQDGKIGIFEGRSDTVSFVFDNDHSDHCVENRMLGQGQKQKAR